MADFSAGEEGTMMIIEEIDAAIAVHEAAIDVPRCPEANSRKLPVDTDRAASGCGNAAHCELQFQLRQMWDWYNNEITSVGGLTFKASSLIAKALHQNATPSEEVRLEAFKAFSAWKGDRDAARRR
jgi:hypothetical protein